MAIELKGEVNAVIAELNHSLRIAKSKTKAAKSKTMAQKENRPVTSQLIQAK
jgi:hypothetical protein